MFVLFAAALLAVVNADLTGVSVAVGDCVCATTNVNGRENPTTSAAVITLLSSGTCATIYGGTQSADGYTWHQIKYGSYIVWVAGNYLSKSSASSCSGGACSATQKSLACDLMAYSNSGVLQLATRHPSGVSDNAYAYNNVNDMCNGLQAARSHYTCSECSSPGAPGGYTCLTNNLLNYLKALAAKGTVIVNELAGACHSCSSRHYNGQAVDLHNDARSQEYMDTCVSMGGWALDEGNHIHCQFYD